ncbi:hypothetical protein BVC80_8317g9 [Macleaya cordata]|uniref:Uncharacterized protein n=1 Tax=Macleaya cordata TaxID=56857 RepID=A0A200QV76_MACCD|nr:hypothetical protein BVC80_8317g9 [Macleaya cordata]
MPFPHRHDLDCSKTRFAIQYFHGAKIIHKSDLESKIEETVDKENKEVDFVMLLILHMAMTISRMLLGVQFSAHFCNT